MSRLRSPTALGIYALLVVGTAIYAVNLRNALFWDDNDLIVTNPYVHELSWAQVGQMFRQDIQAGSGIESNYYRPLLILGFAVNYRLSGLNPWSYHLTGNALHVASSVVLFLILSSVTRRRLVGFLAALAFVIHPLHTEAVTYVSGRGDPLHLFFLLLSLGGYSLAERRRAPWSSWERPVSVLCLALAILSHEKAIAFPFLLVVFSTAFLGEGSLLARMRHAIRRSLPYFALVVGYGVLRLTALNFVDTLDFHVVESAYTEHLSVRMFTFLHVLLVYYRLLVLPVGLHMQRTSEIHLSFFALPVWTSFLVLLALGALLVRLYFRDEPGQGRGANFRIWLFGIAWFFVTLGPVSGITPINAVIYEHWMYVGSIGPATIAAWYLARAYDALAGAGRRPARVALTLALVLYGGFLCAQTVRRNLLWGRPIAFLEDILRYDPENISVNNNLGNEYYDLGNLEQAEFHYKAAARGQTLSAYPDYNLGVLYEERGEVPRAIRHYERALEIDPKFFLPMQALIEAHSRRGEFARVVEWLEPLKRIRADDPHVFLNSALAYQYLNQRDRALADARRARELALEHPDAALASRIDEVVRSLEP